MSSSSSSSSSAPNNNLLPSIHEVFPEFFHPEPRGACNAREDIAVYQRSVTNPSLTLRQTHSPGSMNVESTIDVVRSPAADVSERSLKTHDHGASASRLDTIGNHRPGSPLHCAHPRRVEDVNAFPDTCILAPMLPLHGAEMRSHDRSDDKKHLCPYCPKRFNRPSSLEIHLNTHTGRRPFKCPKCGRHFSVNSNMRRHYRNHDSSSATPSPPYAVAPYHPHTLPRPDSPDLASCAYYTDSECGHPTKAYMHDIHGHRSVDVHGRARNWTVSSYDGRADNSNYSQGPLRPRAATWNASTHVSTTLRPATYSTAWEEKRNLL